MGGDPPDQSSQVDPVQLHDEFAFLKVECGEPYFGLAAGFLVLPGFFPRLHKEGAEDPPNE